MSQVTTKKKRTTVKVQGESSLGATIKPDFNLGTTAILLDVDGTLLDIAPTPLEVQVPDQLRKVLFALWEKLDGAIAFVSGRPIRELDVIFKPLNMPAVGGHGAEIRRTSRSAIQRSHLGQFDTERKKKFLSVADLGPGIITEDKDYSVAIHYRLAPTLGGDVLKAVAAICEADGCDNLDILPGKSVIEIKPRGFDKGSGIHDLMSGEPFKGRRPLFVGDDITDNAAFAALADYSGIGFSVGGIVPGASFNFDGPQDVRIWLEKLSGLTAEPR